MWCDLVVYSKTTPVSLSFMKAFKIINYNKSDRTLKFERRAVLKKKVLKKGGFE